MNIDHPVAKNIIKFLEKRGVDIPADLLALKSDLNSSEMEKIARSIKEMKALGYPEIRNRMWAEVYDNVYGYLDSNRPITVFVQNVTLAISQAFVEASQSAWVDGGGSLPIDEDIVSYGRSELAAQLAYVDSLFLGLKSLRREGGFDTIHESFKHANGYANSLDAFYNYIKVAAAGSTMLTFTGSDGKESCRDCSRYKGQRHKASWWLSRDAIPPSRHFECKGYNCEHRLVDDKGNVFTQ